MSRLFACLVVLTLCAAMCVNECHAQIRARVRQRIAASLAPPTPATPSASPATAATTPSAPPVRGGFLARRMQFRRDLVAQQAAQAQPTPAAPAPQRRQAAQQAQSTSQQTQRTAQRRPLNALRQASAQLAPVLQTITQGQMSKMDLPQLQSALADTNGNLANELNQLSSAASWQQFFNMPAGIVDEGAIDLAALQTALVRFENVAADPKFVQIASLPSFQQSKSLLTELVNRADISAGGAPPSGDGPRLIDPASATQLSAESSESLPAPEPRLPRNTGEHSILVRKSS